jgi:hypothetical protein
MKLLIVTLILISSQFGFAQSIPLPAGFHGEEPLVQTQSVRFHGEQYLRVVSTFPIVKEATGQRADFVQIAIADSTGKNLKEQTFLAPSINISQGKTMTVVRPTEASGISKEVVNALANHTSASIIEALRSNPNLNMSLSNFTLISGATLGSNIDSSHIQSRIGESLNESLQWASSRSASMQNELADRNGEINHFMAQSHEAAVSITNANEIQSKVMALELSGILFTASALDLQNFKIAQISEAFSNPLNSVSESVIYPPADFKLQVLEVNKNLKKHDEITAALLLNQLISPDVKVRGLKDKKEYLRELVDSEGRSKLGADSLLFQEVFITSNASTKLRLVQEANFYQALALNKSYQLANDPSVNSLFRAGVIHLRLADHYFHEGDLDKGESSLYMAKTVGLYIGGLIVGSAWGVIDLAPGVVKTVSEIIGAANTSFDDKDFVAKFFNKTIDQALNYLKPGLSEVVRSRGIEISKEPAFLVGAVSGRIISEFALFWASKGTTTFRGLLVFQLPQNFQQLNHMIKEPAKIFGPIVHGNSYSQLDTILSDDTQIGKWFKEALENEKMKAKHE